MAMILKSAQLADQRVQLTWSDGRSDELPLIWFRDHCPSPQSLHPETKQRQIDTFRIPEALSVRGLEIEDSGAILRIDWQHEDHVSRFDVRSLAPALPPRDPAPQRILWDQATLAEDLPQVAYDDVMSEDDIGLRRWLEQIETYGFCFVMGTPPTPEATEALANRVAYIRHTIFGGFWDFTANLAHKDTAYTTLAIGPHTDGTYSLDAPGYQMLHCLQFDGTGGENVLVDGFKIAELMKRDHPEAFELLTKVEVTGQYIDPDRGIHLMASRPLFRLNSAGELVQVTYNNYDRAPFYLPADEMERFYAALRIFAGYVNDPALHYRRRLQPGEALIFDNWRALHARDAYVGKRRLCGFYLNREDVESRLRVLRPAGSR